MAGDLAALGFSVNSKPLADATNELNKLSVAADRAETSADSLSKSSQKASSNVKKASNDTRQYSNAIKASSLQTSNLAAQFNDIGVMLAAGQSPLQLALQQGTQISQVLNTMGSGTNIVRGLASAFLSIVNPVSLVTIGTIAAGSALAQYIMSLKSDLPSVDEALKSHQQLIKDIEDRWPGATEAMERYAKRSILSMQATAEQNVRVLSKAAKDAQQAFENAVSLSTSITGGASTNMVADRFRPFQDAIDQLRAGIRAANPDFEQFNDQVNEVVSKDPKGLRDLGTELKSLAVAVETADNNARSASTSFNLIGDAASGQVAKVAQLTEAFRILNAAARPALTEMDKVNQAYDVARTAGDIQTRIQAEKAYRDAMSRFSAQSMPIPGQRPNLESIAPEKGKTGRSDAEREADRQAKAISRVTENLQFELNTMGMSAQSMRLQNALRQAGVDLYSEEGQKISDLVEKINAKEAATKAVAEADKQAKETQEKFVHAMDNGLNMIGDTILSIADGSDKASDAVKRLAVELALAAAQAASFGSGPLAGLFGGGSFGGGFKSTQLAGALASGSIGLFANGGVTNKPAIFGEAGPEAAVPLPDGRHIPVKMMGEASAALKTSTSQPM